ncbi:MAG: O-antigen ligase family protein [Chromatiaceae bacterium]|nr:O-antigen ligase family protein [Chromatiaceae bacterium]MCF8015273.1 O-antigen ligase family protein [Chromatiaceae bacterium]
MMAKTHTRKAENPLIRPILWLLIAILIVTPLFRAGLTPLAALLSQLLAVGLLSVTLWSPRRLELRPIEWLFIFLLLLTPLLYLIPLPATLVASLPGREPYAAALALFPNEDMIRGWRPLTLVPFSTAAAAVALLLPISVFIATRALDTERARLLVKVLLAITALQALIGLLQFGVAQGGLETAWGIKAGTGGSGTGTYPNRNHLAGLIEMMLPIVLALLFYNLGRRESGAPNRGLANRAAFWGSKSGNATIIYGSLALLLIIATVFTRSRTGIFLAMLAILLSTIVFARRIGGSNVYGPAGTIISLAVAAGIAIGLSPVLDRFSIGNMEEDARFTLFELSFQGAGQFFPFGSGPGTFPDVFPALQPIELGRFFINRAHNDYLEWFFDAGLLGLAMVVLVLAIYLRQWLKLSRAGDWSRGRFLQAGAGLGMLMVGLHEFVDYNLYTPANQVAFAVLAGVFFMPPERLTATDKSHRRRNRRTPDLDVTPAAPPPTVGPAQPPPNQIPNPFL